MCTVRYHNDDMYNFISTRHQKFFIYKSRLVKIKIVLSGDFEPWNYFQDEPGNGKLSPTCQCGHATLMVEFREDLILLNRGALKIFLCSDIQWK